MAPAQINRHRLFTGCVLLTLSALAVALPSPTLAGYVPPLTDVQEWVEMDGWNRSVHFAVYDPSRSAWRESSASFSGGPFSYYNLLNVTTQGGVVTWYADFVRSNQATIRQVWYAVYDLARGTWRTGYWECPAPPPTRQWSWDLRDLLVRDGVVTWLAYKVSSDPFPTPHDTYDLDLCYVTYDAISGEWKQGLREILDVPAPSDFHPAVLSHNGIVAWTTATYNSETGYAVYDATRGSWQTGQISGIGGNLSIANESVSFLTSTHQYTKGYDPSTGAWFDGTTKPLSCFTVLPGATFTEPSTVWFADMSIGGTSWTWTFGDGSQSTDRNPWHHYGWGVHTATQSVTGPGGTASSSATIRIGMDRAYVNASAPGPVHNGRSWQTAFLSPVDAMDAVFDGGEIWVAAGEYTCNITLRPSTSIYGGFAGTETEREQRDWQHNLSIIRGTGDGTVVTVPPGATATTVIDGFTITGGLNYSGGGGIFCDRSSPTIRNNVITNNASPIVTSSLGEGGGICCRQGSPVISGNTIEENDGGHGGGIYCQGGSPTITGNLIRENTADSGGGIYANAGTISANTIEGNTASYRGGGIYALGGVIERNTIRSNVSHSQAGGVYCASSSSRIAGNLIVNNRVDASQGDEVGGGLLINNASPNMVNNTIVGNVATNGGGIACIYASKPPLSNNIVAFCSSGIYCATGSVPTTSYNCVFGNTSYDWQGVQPGSTTVSKDPLFADRAHGDYHLTVLSPCFNRGDSSAAGMPTVDLDGETRVLLGTVDIGADEYNGPASPISEMKKRANGEPVYVEGIVTYVYSSYVFWIESDSRTSGIAVVKANHGASVGDRVAVVGKLSQISNYELDISATQIIQKGNGTVEPLAMPNQAVGGQGWFFVQSPYSGQKGIDGAVGLNNIGLLVKTWGRVTYVGSSYFYIDDGSGLNDGSGHTGIRMYFMSGVAPPQVGEYVVVTGISSTFYASPALRRMIRVRDQEDIQVVPKP